MPFGINELLPVSSSWSAFGQQFFVLIIAQGIVAGWILSTRMPEWSFHIRLPTTQRKSSREWQLDYRQRSEESIHSSCVLVSFCGRFAFSQRSVSKPWSEVFTLNGG